jgi:hypothetical protein
MATPSADRHRPRTVHARPRRRVPRPPAAAPDPAPVNWRVVGVVGGPMAVAVISVAFLCAAHRRAAPPPADAAPVAEVAAALLPPAPVDQPPPLVAEPPAPEPGALKPAGSAPPTDVSPGAGAAGFAKGHGEAPRFRRRDLLSADELSRQLLAAPEIDIDAQAGTSSRLVDAARMGSSKQTPPILGPLLARADLHGLPVAMGADCQLGKESSDNLQVLSRKLRFQMSLCVPQGGLDPRLDAAVLRERLVLGHADAVAGTQAQKKAVLAARGAVAAGFECSAEDWRQEEAIPALVQMLQAEDRPVRLLLVELLGAIKGRCASAALAGRALFDLSPEVREAAVRALADRPRDEYRGQLLAAFRYPWAPAADHAAEALVALDDRASVRRLTALLSEPDPSAPASSDFHYFDPALIRKTPRTKGALPDSAVVLDAGRDGDRRTRLLADPDDVASPVKAPPDGVVVVREVVRVNHLRNCLLCHAAATAATDPVRGLVPSQGQPLPPPFTTPYYEGQSGTFVRADVTYLRQDFSVPQPVEKADNWPAHQRYDYLVRTRYATRQELFRPAAETYPQREAVRWALQQFGVKDG